VFGATRFVVFEALIRLATCGSRRCCHVVEPSRPGMPPALPTSMNRFTNLLADGEFEAAARQMISHIDTVEAGLTRQIGKDPLIDLRIALLRPLKPERPDP